MVKTQTDIEHIVARSEAHDSGLCAADAATWSAFASDLLNFAPASSSVNRHQKVDKDAAELLSYLNQCWLVSRTIQLRHEYELTIDQAGADAIHRVLSGCKSTEMVVLSPGFSMTPRAPATPTRLVTWTPWPCGMTIETAASLALRPMLTVSCRSGVATQPIHTCVTRMEAAWCANK